MVDCTLRGMGLEGFRSIYSQHVEFDNPTFVLGPNGAGKSNFADAFAFLSEAMSSPLRAVIERRGGFSAVSYRGSPGPGPAELTLSVRLERPDSDTASAFYGAGRTPDGRRRVAAVECPDLRGGDRLRLSVSHARRADRREDPADRGGPWRCTGVPGPVATLGPRSPR